jgi:hypothetical protein
LKSTIWRLLFNDNIGRHNLLETINSQYHSDKKWDMSNRMVVSILAEIQSLISNLQSVQNSFLFPPFPNLWFFSNSLNWPNSQKFFIGKLLEIESSAETLHPTALVYSCTSPRFYLLKGSDHVVSTYFSVNFFLTWSYFCRNTTPSEYCCSFADTRPVHLFLIL